MAYGREAIYSRVVCLGLAFGDRRPKRREQAYSLTRHLPDELCQLNEDVLCRTAFDIANTTSVHGPDPFV